METTPVTTSSGTQGTAPMATGEDSLNSSTSTGDEEELGLREERDSSSTPQFDDSIRSGTPQAKISLTPNSSNLRLFQELDDAFSSLDQELKHQETSQF